MKSYAAWQKGNWQKSSLYRLFLFSGFPIWTLFLLFHVVKVTRVGWPQKSGEVLFCSSDCLEDLPFFLASSIKGAKHTLFASSFGIDDPTLIHLLYERALLGKSVEVAFDANQIHMIGSRKNLKLLPFKGKGRLMHRKVLALDEDLLLFGSMNLTTSSLKLHRNQCVAVRSKELYDAMRKNIRFDSPFLSFYPIPEEGKSALDRLIQEITNAKREIFIAMYTFTNQKILDALIAAKDRGVVIKLYVDRGMAQGASKKCVARCIENGISTAKSMGDGYLHYKCALIDNTYVTGSANWTDSGFCKNFEYLLFFPSLTKGDLAYLKRFFHQLKMTCKELV